MLITNISMVTGISRTIDLPITKEQLDRWKNGELIQSAMPDLTAEQREFIITGTSPKEWESLL
jgi:hypothetical protein